MRAFSQNIFKELCLFFAIVITITIFAITISANAAPAKSKTESKLAPKNIQATPVDTQKFPNISKIYKVEWVNMDVGYFYADIKSNGNIVNFDFRANSVGFADKFAKFMWNSNTVAKFKTDKFIPVSVDRTSRLKKKIRNMKLKYDANGNIIFDQTIPAESTDKRPATPQADKDKSFDVLTMILEVRSRVIDIVKQNKFNGDSTNFTLPLYDGRKRSNIRIDVFKGVKNGLFKMRVQQKLVSGYTKTEITNEKKNAVYIDVLVDTQNFMPVSASGRSGLGSATAEFVGDCKGNFEDCIKR